MSKKPKKTYDIEEYRKRKKREKLLHRIIRLVIVLVLICGVAGGVYFYQKYDMWAILGQPPSSVVNSQETSVQTGSFPISLDAVTPLELETYQNGSILLTDEELLVVNADGTVPNQFVHSFTNPVLRIGHEQFLLYDRGGYGYRMEDAAGSLASGRTTNSMLAGACGYDSHFALVTAESHYAASVTVYDETGKNILTWYSLEQVVDVAFSQDDRYLAVASVLFEDSGTMVSRVHLLDIEREEEVGSADYSDAMPVAVHLKEDGWVHLVTDSFLGVMSPDLSEQRKVPFLQQLSRYQFEDDATLLVNSGASEVASTVSLVSSEGEKTEVTVESSIRDISMDGKDICLLTGSGLFWYDSALSQQGSRPVSSEIYSICCSGGSVYTMSSNSLSQMEMAEESESVQEEASQ